MAEVKEVTGIHHGKLIVDVSDEACQKFGFNPGQRVIQKHSGITGTVVGVAPAPSVPGPPCIEPGSNLLWISFDEDEGKISFVPNPQRNLKILPMH